MSAPQDTLFYPFEKNLLSLPQQPQKWLAINLHNLPATIWQPFLTLVQSWRGDYLKAHDKGFEVSAAWPENNTLYDGIMLLTSKHRKHSENQIMDALSRLQNDGVLVVAGAKNSGIEALLKWVKKMAPDIAHLSKYHGIVFWLRKNDIVNSINMQELYHQPQIIENQFVTVPGLFSWNKIDIGSALLVQSLNDVPLTGRVADLGAGWGYLSARALETHKDITQMDLYEADHMALTYAQKNLEMFKDQGVDINFHWHDMRHENLPDNYYDAIITNPPFHSDKQLDIQLGQIFIEKAARALKPGGTLWLVANRQLPYETILKQKLPKNTTVMEQKGYKIIKAYK